MTKRGIPLSAMEQLLRDAGAHRVSEGAKKALKVFIEAQSVSIGEKAVRLASHAGRKTVKEEDVKLATRS